MGTCVLYWPHEAAVVHVVVARAVADVRVGDGVAQTEPGEAEDLAERRQVERCRVEGKVGDGGVTRADV